MELAESTPDGGAVGGLLQYQVCGSISTLDTLLSRRRHGGGAAQNRISSSLLALARRQMSAPLNIQVRGEGFACSNGQARGSSPNSLLLYVVCVLPQLASSPTWRMQHRLQIFGPS